MIVCDKISYFKTFDQKDFEVKIATVNRKYFIEETKGYSVSAMHRALWLAERFTLSNGIRCNCSKLRGGREQLTRDV